MLPGSMLEMRDPTAQEVQVAEQGNAAIAMECPAGSVAMWDGRVCEYRHAAAPLLCVAAGHCEPYSPR